MTPARLVTIPISHYCEKARWALERAGIPYVEERHVQGIHRLAARRAGGRTVPVLVDGSRVITESAEIVEYADARVDSERRLIPAADAVEIAELVRWLDSDLGPPARLLMYHHLLERPDLARSYGLEGVSGWERAALRLGFPAARRWIRRELSVDAPAAAAAQGQVTTVFDRVADRLSDGRAFLIGPRFTAADVTFAALAAAVLMPEGYGVRLPPRERLPPVFRAQVAAFRAHPAGTFALRMFQQERRPARTRPSA